jgi:hypothetical protein
VDAVAALAAIKAAYQDASGLSSGLVVWEDEEQAYWPAGEPCMRLNVTAAVREMDPRQTASLTDTLLSAPYRFTVRALVESITNEGSALRTALSTCNKFEFTPWVEIWQANGIAIIDCPLAPTRLNRSVDGRMLAVFATDARFRAVLTDTIGQVSATIATVTGTGTIQPGDIDAPFTASII